MVLPRRWTPSATAQSQQLQKQYAIPFEKLTKFPQLNKDLDIQQMTAEAASRSVDQKAAITKEMCKMLGVKAQSLKNLMSTVSRILPDDLNHRKPFSRTQDLKVYKAEQSPSRVRRVSTLLGRTNSIHDLHRTDQWGPGATVGMNAAMDAISAYESNQVSRTAKGHAGRKNEQSKSRAAPERKISQSGNAEMVKLVQRRTALLKVLHELAANHVLRGVPSDQIVFSIDRPPPFKLECETLLRYATAALNLPIRGKWKYLLTPKQGRSELEKLVTMQISRKIFHLLFWYCHSTRFQDTHPFVLRRMVDKLGSHFTTLLSRVKTKSHSLRDFIFTTYPFAMAFAVCAAFHFHCPGSRNIYSYSFKHSIWMDICGLVSGTLWCPASIISLRHTLYGEAKKVHESSNSNIDKTTDEMVVDKGQIDKIERLEADSLGFDKLGISGAMDRDDVEKRNNNFESGEFRRHRLPFRARMVSPLCSTVLPKSLSATTLQWAYSEATASDYVPSDIKQINDRIGEIKEQNDRNETSCNDGIKGSRDEISGKLDKLEEQGMAILSQGGAEYARFVSDLPNLRLRNKQARERAALEKRQREEMQEMSEKQSKMKKSKTAPTNLKGEKFRWGFFSRLSLKIE